jgi:hypothetical protein
MKKTGRKIISYADGIAAYAKRQGFILPPGVLERARRIPGQFVVTDDEEPPARVTCVLCMPDGAAEFFPDDIRTTCARCGQRVHHRPSVPKWPPKLCLDCAMHGPEDGSPEDWRRYIARGSKREARRQ